MDKKIIRNSILSLILGVIISALSLMTPKSVAEIVNFAGGMCILGGFIFIDQSVMKHIYKDEKPSRKALLRLVVYLILAVVLILAPLKAHLAVEVVRISKAFGIAFLLLALWRFFTFTTVEEEQMHVDILKKK
ncbi:MAG: hypothetical protein K6A30_06640 [Lachnospiraceae bacterium]|nr:hypothetical protein [Lachnospiraceae bacterium]